MARSLWAIWSKKLDDLKNTVAVIMAGGKGTRLSSITQDLIPKPMVKLCGIPIIEHQIRFLEQNGIKNIIVVVGHLGNIIKEYLKDGKWLNVNISYIEENEPLGSAGALFYLKYKINSDFFLIFGDTYFNIDLKKMFYFHKNHKASITLFAHPNSHPYDSDIIEYSDNNVVTNLYKKTDERPKYLRNLVNAAFFILNPNVLESLTELKKVDMEKDLVKSRIFSYGDVYAYKSSEYIKDAGTVDRLCEIEADIKKDIPTKRNLSNKQKCIFLDRDGTLNKFNGFITSPDDLELLPNVAEAVLKVNNSQYLAIVITNQPVIARGECSIQTLNRIHGKLDELLSENKAYLNDLYYCPHHPHKGFSGEIEALKIDCNCRKPKIGLFEEASKDYNIDATNSYMIGDSERDIQFGKNAKLKTIFVSTGEQKLNELAVMPDYNFNSLLEAINFIISEDTK